MTEMDILPQNEAQFKFMQIDYLLCFRLPIDYLGYDTMKYLFYEFTYPVS